MYYVAYWQQPLQGIDVQWLCMIYDNICVKSEAMMEVLHQVNHNDSIYTGLGGQIPVFSFHHQCKTFSHNHCYLVSHLSRHDNNADSQQTGSLADVANDHEHCCLLPFLYRSIIHAPVSVITLTSWEYLHFIKINRVKVKHVDKPHIDSAADCHKPGIGSLRFHTYRSCFHWNIC